MTIINNRYYHSNIFLKQIILKQIIILAVSPCAHLELCAHIYLYVFFAQ